jgi:hypothetical protein
MTDGIDQLVSGFAKVTECGLSHFLGPEPRPRRFLML